MTLAERLMGAVAVLMQDISEADTKEKREFWLNFSNLFNEAATELQTLRQRNAEFEAELELATDKLDKINNWCRAYPIEIFTEPDWNEVQSKLGNLLLTQVSGSNMRHVVNGISKIIEASKD